MRKGGVGLDEFGDDIEEVSGDGWKLTTRVRTEHDDRSESSLPLGAAESPFQAVKIAGTTPRRRETSPLSDEQNDEGSPMSLDKNIPVPRTASLNRQAELPSDQIAHAEAASTVESIIVDATDAPEIATAPLLPSLAQLE
jgi:hypothetical protein